MSERTKYTLTHPIRIGDREVTELNFRELELGDLAAISLKISGDGVALDGKMVMTLLGKLTGELDAVISKIKGADIMGAGTIAMGFIGAVLPSTGDEESQE